MQRVLRPSALVPSTICSCEQRQLAIHFGSAAHSRYNALQHITTRLQCSTTSGSFGLTAAAAVLFGASTYPVQSLGPSSSHIAHTARCVPVGMQRRHLLRNAIESLADAEPPLSHTRQLQVQQSIQIHRLQRAPIAYCE